MEEKCNELGRIDWSDTAHKEPLVGDGLDWTTEVIRSAAHTSMKLPTSLPTTKCK